jgi:hypothetical protein
MGSLAEASATRIPPLSCQLRRHGGELPADLPFCFYTKAGIFTNLSARPFDNRVCDVRKQIYHERPHPQINARRGI